MRFPRISVFLLFGLACLACAEDPVVFAGRAVKAVEGGGLSALEPYLDPDSAVLLRSLPGGLEAPKAGQPATCALEEALSRDQILVRCQDGARSLTLLVQEAPQAPDGLQLNLFAPVFRGSSLPGEAP